MVLIRLNMDPSPPAPGLFMSEKSVSAGCEQIAAATPATVPDARLMPSFVPFDVSAGLASRPRRALARDDFTGRAEEALAPEFLRGVTPSEFSSLQLGGLRS